MVERQHFDVLIVGAGISGIAAAHHLQARCPTKSYAVLEARQDLGGTWDLFRYPGIRSDSDMHTLGYSFRPWKEAKAIADGPSILRYLRDTASEAGIDRKIRYGMRVEHARWSSERARWTVRVRHADSGDTETLTCNFLWACTGYYRYEAGYTPDFPGTERFEGLIVHPQKWTDDIEYEAKRVVVIGSGATAMTLVPALSERAAHVTMLQRSPTYVVAMPYVDRISEWLKARLPQERAYAVTRWKNVLLALLFYQFSRKFPDRARRLLIGGVRRAVGGRIDIEKHFTPSYDPWDQRVCLVPDGDLFEALRAGRASVVTDHIDTFTEKGIRLRSGEELEADLIVTATGLQLQFLGGATLEVDGVPVEPREHMMYKGMMLSGVPNLAISLGYTNASWTLKCELTCEYVCRLLNHMDEHGYTHCYPHRDASVKEEPALDLMAGYILRSLHELPTQGSRAPWRLRQNYLIDRLTIRHGAVDDGAMRFRRAPDARRQATPAVATP